MRNADKSFYVRGATIIGGEYRAHTAGIDPPRPDVKRGMLLIGGSYPCNLVTREFAPRTSLAEIEERLRLADKCLDKIVAARRAK